MRIYLAGPLFTAAERAFNEELGRRLEAHGHTVWVPQEHEPPIKTAKAIFQFDMVGLAKAEVVVANFDGPDVDSGTAWECGYAFTTGTPVIGFRTDLRTLADEGEPVNIMLSQSARTVLLVPKLSVAEIADRIAAALIPLMRG